MSEGVSLKTISELKDKKFYIPGYQRGYRWTKQQVKDLLDDVWEFMQKEGDSGAFYCLQPLVVKEKDNGELEVIDGQQRLTTIYIILSCLGEQKLYSLNYETRKGSESFLKDIQSKQDGDGNENIDYFHMVQTKIAVEKWLKDKEKEKGKLKNDFLEKVKFIWYETSESETIKVFTRLNIGKIGLTNAELIKALFLNSSNFGMEDIKCLRLRQQEIASEWDNIEYTLQNDEFWLFLHEKGYCRPTRIDFIFDLICNHKILGEYEDVGTDDYKTFRYFYKYFKSDSSDIEECWGGVKSYFQTFKEWFDDLELYHYIGYLIECECSISDLILKWREHGDKDAFVKYLKDKIKAKIKKCPELSFQYKEDGSDKVKCKPILLFQNVQTVINQNKNNLNNGDYKLGVFYKFPFHLYKLERWDVEHINSNATNDEDDTDTQKEWLLNVYLSVDDNTQEEIRSYFKSDEDEKENLFKEIKKKIQPNDEWTVEEKNQIWNYTLLDSSTNRSYGNAIFSGKRRVIIGKDKGVSIAIPKIGKDGKFQLSDKAKAKSCFVPPCTKQVFMKYYSATMSDANYWTRADATGYLNDIEECIKKLEG